MLAGLVAGLTDVTEVGVSTGGNAATTLGTAIVGGVTFHAVMPLEFAVEAFGL